MSDFLRYDHFNRLSAPVAVIRRSGDLIYHNRAAGSVSRKFRNGTDLLSFFDNGAALIDRCIHTKRPTPALLRFSETEKYSVLLIPDFSPEGTQILIVMAPMLEGTLCYAPSTVDRLPEPFAAGTAEIPGPRELSPLGGALVRSYAKLPKSLCSELDERSASVGAACLFLNRLFERVFTGRDCSAEAKCTSDCIDFPLEHFVELSACLAYLSVMLAVNAGGEKLTVCFLCESERPRILFTCDDRKARGERLSALFPDRKVELTILEAMLDHLGYDARIHDCPGTSVELTGRSRFPAHLFKSPDDAARLYESLLVAELLKELTEE